MKSLFILQLVCCVITAMLALQLAMASLQVRWKVWRYEISRWILVASMLFFSVHYLLQMIHGLRAQGTDVGAAFNILFYTPVAFAITLSIINIESTGNKVRRYSPEKKTEPVLRVHEPLDKNTKFPEVPALFQKLNYPEIDYMQEPSPSSGEEKEEIPERYEITGYVQRSNPHRATGVTFDDMDMIEKAMASDELTEAEQEQARQTFQKLEGTNMERVLQASVLGSSDKLKRYMRLYVDRGEPHLLTGKNRDDILREFDITEHVPQ